MGFHSRNSISVNCGLTYQSMWHTQQLRKPSFFPKQWIDLVMALCQEGCSLNIRAFNYMRVRTSCHRNRRSSSVFTASPHWKDNLKGWIWTQQLLWCYSGYSCTAAQDSDPRPTSPEGIQSEWLKMCHLRDTGNCRKDISICSQLENSHRVF